MKIKIKSIVLGYKAILKLIYILLNYNTQNMLKSKLSSLSGEKIPWSKIKIKKNPTQNKSIFEAAHQSQKHGFIFENEIRTKVFDLPTQGNDRNVHDIPKQKNKFSSNENISIKTTGSLIICCGDILRFFNYNFKEINTIIVVKYLQNDTQKVIKNIYEINYNEDCHRVLFGNLTKEIIESYVNGVKSIPLNVKGKEAKKIFNYLVEKKKLEKQFPHNIQINPKVNGTQSRVQCSIKDFEKVLKNFITYKSSDECPNIIREKEIVLAINSSKRKRNKKE